MTRRTDYLAKNIEFVGYNALNNKPGVQMAMQKIDAKYYLYTASYHHNGINIVNVTDPYHPVNIKWMEGFWAKPDLKDGQSIPQTPSSFHKQTGGGN